MNNFIRARNAFEPFIVALSVFFIRIPIMGICMLLIIVGHGAERVYDWVDKMLPAYRRNARYAHSQSARNSRWVDAASMSRDCYPWRKKQKAG